MEYRSIFNFYYCFHCGNLYGYCYERGMYSHCITITDSESRTDCCHQRNEYDLRRTINNINIIRCQYIFMEPFHSTECNNRL